MKQCLWDLGGSQGPGSAISKDLLSKGALSTVGNANSFFWPCCLIFCEVKNVVGTQAEAEAAVAVLIFYGALVKFSEV